MPPRRFLPSAPTPSTSIARSSISAPSSAEGPVLYVAGWQVFGTNREQAWEWSRSALVEIAGHASGKGVTIAIEPTSADSNLVDSCDDALRMMREAEQGQRQAHVRHLSHALSERGGDRLCAAHGRRSSPRPSGRCQSRCAERRGQGRLSRPDRCPRAGRDSTDTSRWRSVSTGGQSSRTGSRAMPTGMCASSSTILGMRDHAGD